MIDRDNQLCTELSQEIGDTINRFFQKHEGIHATPYIAALSTVFVEGLVSTLEGVRQDGHDEQQQTQFFSTMLQALHAHLHNKLNEKGFTRFLKVVPSEQVAGEEVPIRL